MSTSNVARKPMLVLAACATVVSICIAVFAGGERGGTPAERSMGVALAVIAVLFVHLAPMYLSSFGMCVRVIAAGLWLAGLAVVAYGQASFVLLAQVHAENARAISVAVAAMPAPVMTRDARSLGEIADDIATVQLKLTRVETIKCQGRCPGLVIRKAALATRLAALNVEANEAKRRELTEDRVAAYVERDDALRERLRVDPVASRLAPWLRTTESTLSLSFAVASAVVLEGAAILSWLAAGVASGRSVSRVSRADVSLAVGASQAHGSEIVSAEHDGGASGERTVDAVAALSDDERELERIHAAVLAGHLKPTQKAIRRYLGCGQLKAGRMNRLYAEQFGCAGTEVA